MESTLKVLEKKDVQAEREAAVKAVQDTAEKLRADKAEAIAKAEAAKAAEEAQASEAAENTEEAEA